MTPDPIGILGLIDILGDEFVTGDTNLYGYVVNNPLRWIDPFGLNKIDPNAPSGGTEHESNQRPSTQGKHEQGQARKKKDRGGEKADKERRSPRKRPKGWKGPWPGLGPLLPFDPCFIDPKLCNPWWPLDPPPMSCNDSQR